MCIYVYVCVCVYLCVSAMAPTWHSCLKLQNGHFVSKYTCVSLRIYFVVLHFNLKYMFDFNPCHFNVLAEMAQ